MKKYGYLLFTMLVGSSATFAQQVTFTEHIAPLIYQKCTPCHRPGEAAPFSLITYDDVIAKGKFIGKVTQSRYMPPWRADADFGEFKNNKRLRDDEIALLQQWIAAGMPKGDKPVPEPPSFAEGTQLGSKPDLTLKMNHAHAVKGDNQEQFMLFSLPTNLPEDKYISAVEFRPGNKKVVHHVRFSIDTTLQMRVTDDKSIDDPSIAEYGKIRMKEEYWYGWVPGNNPVHFPANTAKKIPKNSDILLNVHYAPSPIDDADQSSVNLYFAKDSVERPVYTFILDESTITNQPFLLPADSVITFFARSVPIPYPISLISVLPHMHVLGKNIRCFAITPDGDVIPLLKIGNWDFNWQMTYEYKSLVRIPAGSVLYAEATYDNTAQNPENPNSPPKPVTYGWQTKSEMMNLIFQYVRYQVGDEFK